MVRRSSMASLTVERIDAFRPIDEALRAAGISARRHGGDAGAAAARQGPDRIRRRAVDALRLRGRRHARRRARASEGVARRSIARLRIAMVPLLIENIRLQFDGGADVVMVFDTAAGELAPDDVRVVIAAGPRAAGRGVSGTSRVLRRRACNRRIFGMRLGAGVAVGRPRRRWHWDLAGALTAPAAGLRARQFRSASRLQLTGARARAGDRSDSSRRCASSTPHDAPRLDLRPWATACCRARRRRTSAHSCNAFGRAFRDDDRIQRTVRQIRRAGAAVHELSDRARVARARRRRDEWIASLARALDAPDATLSLYVHLPFCESLCTFCGCNTVITRDHGRAQPYVDLVLRELDAYLARVPALGHAARVPDAPRRRHADVSVAGPARRAGRRRLRAADTRRRRVRRIGRGRSARHDRRAHLETLRARGFTRLSLGVQDFNAETQRLVNRMQSDAARRATSCAHAREQRLRVGQLRSDLRSARADARVDARDRRAGAGARAGSPRGLQLRARAVDQAAAAQVQATIRFPSAPRSARCTRAIREPLLEHGYVELGMDHFAQAARTDWRAPRPRGTMHRNFQGYTERRTTALLGLGVSAISETPDCYHQNEKVDHRLRAARRRRTRFRRCAGTSCRTDDRARREKILSLMTGFRVPLDPERSDDARTFLAPMIEDGLVEHRRRRTAHADARPRRFSATSRRYSTRTSARPQPSGPTLLEPCDRQSVRSSAPVCRVLRRRGISREARRERARRSNGAASLAG